MNCLKKYPLVSNDTELCMELTSTEKVDAQEKISYTTYGMRVLDQGGNALYFAEDVDTKQEYVERFIRLCSENDVRLIHLPDLLEDYLGH